MKRPSLVVPYLVFAFALASIRAEGNRAENTVILDEAGVANLNLETVEADEQVFEETLFALGRVAPLPEKRAVVSSRISGKTVSLSARPNRAVKAGSSVLTVESRQAGNPPPRIALSAPIDGTVVSVSTAVGQPVSPDDSLIEIMDLS
ncbi:MAG: hypothetical protein AAF514_20350, partial [Verrucomicrobiota bacterium]